VLLLATARDRVQPEALAFWFVALRAASIPIFVAVVRWRLRQPLRVAPDLAPPLLRYGAPNVLAVLPNELNYRLDQLLLAAFLPSGALGIYVVAVAWSQLQSPALLAFSALLFPRVAADADRAAQRAIVGRGMRAAVLVAGACSAATALVTPTLLPLLFGDEFRSAVPTAVVLTLAAGIAGVNLVAQEAARGLGRPRAVLLAQLVGLAVTGASLAVLLPDLRIFGAALASVLGYGTVGVVLVQQLRSETGASGAELLVPRGRDVRDVARVLRHPGSRA
jgi:O-antigen/teichoic acid export membrane protein